MTVIALRRSQNRLSAISLNAMALNIPAGDHPNRMPFSGILVRLDEPSDGAPSGSYSRKIIVTTAAARKALPSLLGMSVGYTPSFDGHDAKHKIGVITSADIIGNAIAIAGFVYAADFPETARTIRAQKSVLGFSFEAQRITVLDPCADVLTITDLAFTGAAILRRDKAAYQSTSIAASAAKIEGLDMTPEEIKAAIQAALGEQTAAETKQKEAMQKAVAEAVEAATKPLIDQIAAANTRAENAMAKVRLKAAAPQRKTMPGMEGRLSSASIEGDEQQRIAMKNGVALG